jgi:hypothetical protein
MRFEGNGKLGKWVIRVARHPLLREALILLCLYWAYSIIRWFVAHDSPYQAFNNAYRLVRLEKELGIFIEPWVQDRLINDAMIVVHFANWFYTFGYFPVLVLAAILLYRSGEHRFRVFKFTFLLGLGFALMVYSLFPLAPPRLLPGAGLVDTQREFGVDLYNQKSVISFYNPYAAMPSLHFGWALLVGLMALSFRHLWLKLVGFLYPACMALVIVATGHHYLMDILGGGAIIGLAFSLVKVLPVLQRAPLLIDLGQ